MRFLKTLPLFHRLANQAEQPAPAESGQPLLGNFGHGGADYTVPDTAEPGGEILSANFGTDDFFAGVGVANGIDTSGFPELSGMPVVLDQSIDFNSVEPADLKSHWKTAQSSTPFSSPLRQQTEKASSRHRCCCFQRIQRITR